MESLCNASESVTTKAWCALVGCKVKGTALTNCIIGEAKTRKTKRFRVCERENIKSSFRCIFRLPFFFLSSPSVCLATRNKSERFGSRWTLTHKKKALKNRREARRRHKNNLRLLFKLQKFWLCNKSSYRRHTTEWFKLLEPIKQERR